MNNSRLCFIVARNGIDEFINMTRASGRKLKKDRASEVALGVDDTRGSKRN